MILLSIKRMEKKMPSGCILIEVEHAMLVAELNSTNNRTKITAHRARKWFMWSMAMAMAILLINGYERVAL